MESLNPLEPIDKVHDGHGLGRDLGGEVDDPTKRTAKVSNAERRRKGSNVEEMEARRKSLLREGSDKQGLRQTQSRCRAAGSANSCTNFTLTTLNSTMALNLTKALKHEHEAREARDDVVSAAGDGADADGTT